MKLGSWSGWREPAPSIKRAYQQVRRCTCEATWTIDDDIHLGGRFPAVMISTDVAPVLGLEEEFPFAVVVITDPTGKRYGRFISRGEHGLMVWSSVDAVQREFLLLNAPSGDRVQMRPVEVTFDQARKIAKDAGLPVTCLLLMDCPQNPAIHYVR